MKAKKKKEQTPMEKLTKGYEKFIKEKKINENGQSEFDKTIKKSLHLKKKK